MSYAAHAAAAAAYRGAQQLDQRPAAVLAAAHQELARLAASAISAYRAGALDEMCRCNGRAVRLLGGLIAALEGRSPEADRFVREHARLRDAFNRMLFEPAAIETLQMGVEWSKNLTRLFLKELS
jgi:hypothetical protein